MASVIQPELIPADDTNWKRKEDALAITPTPASMLDLAIRQNLDADKLEKIMGLFERWEANESRKQFEQAMADFKAEHFVIPKDKKNTQYGSWYTSLEKMVEVVTPFLAKHKLCATWSVDQASGIKVTCTLEAFGHSKSCSVVFPPDVSGKKNSLQEIKSAITYGKICTYESVCGLASEAGNLSDDGNAAGKAAQQNHQGGTMDADDLKERDAHFDKCMTYQEVDAHYKASFEEAYKLKDQNAKDTFIAAKRRAYARLREKQ